MFESSQAEALQPMKSTTSVYFRHALFISRRPYGRAAVAFTLSGAMLVAAGMWLKAPFLLAAAAAVVAVGLVPFTVSVAGLYRFYGRPALADYRRIVEATGLGDGCDAIAELHIGTYRHARALAELLPRS